jgi:hypothetical protein
MPPYRFAGPGPYDFPASRDTRGIPLGTVEPGDVRDLDEPIGPWWVPASDGQGAEPASSPPGIPAPAAAPPASPATQTSEAGVTGSEEG